MEDKTASWRHQAYMQANAAGLSAQIFMFLILTKQYLLPYSARRTSTTGATVTNGKWDKSQWHVPRDKLCSSIGLHFATQGLECLELKPVIWFHAGGWFSWVNVPPTICVLFSVPACLATETLYLAAKRLPTCVALFEGFQREKLAGNCHKEEKKKTTKGLDVMFLR